MNELRVSPKTRTRASAILLVALALSASLVATTIAPVGAYDPSRPASSTGKGGGTPPGGEDPGGGGGGTQRKVALGIARPQVPATNVDSVTAALGKKPAIWVIWNQWGNSDNRDFPSTAAAQLKARNIQPMIWWEPVIPGDLSNPMYARHRNITAGNHDDYIRQWARDAAAFGDTVLLRFAHEINNNYFPWSVNSFDNSPTTFINAWRHVVDIFREEGATNVKWVWSVAKQVCSGGCNPYTVVYPGNAYVDIMAFSGYNWGAHPDKNWTSMYDSFRKATNKLREISDKPIMVAETASNSIGGDKPAWIRNGYREVYNELPDIEAIVYLDADLRSVGHPDWRISTPSAALDAYAEIANLSRFDTRSPFGARKSGKARLDDDKGKKQRTKKAEPKPKKTPVVKKKPVVKKGENVDAKSQQNDSRSADNKVTKKPKGKKKPEPVQVLDPFAR